MVFIRRSQGVLTPSTARMCLLLCLWPALLLGAVLPRPPRGDYGTNILRGGKMIQPLRDPSHAHPSLPTSSEQPVKQIPPPSPTESLQPTPSLARAGYYLAATPDGAGPPWATAEGVLGQPQFRLLWATEGPAPSRVPRFLDAVTRATVPAALTPHST